jgi:hypothetical protein
VEPVLEIDERSVGPDLLAQLLAGNHVARMRQQNQQNLKWLARETDTDPTLEQFPGRDIHFERSEGQSGRGLGLGQHIRSAAGQDSVYHGPEEMVRRVDKCRPVNEFADEGIYEPQMSAQAWQRMLFRA